MAMFQDFLPLNFDHQVCRNKLECQELLEVRHRSIKVGSIFAKIKELLLDTRILRWAPALLKNGLWDEELAV